MSFNKEYEEEMNAFFEMVDETMVLMEERMKHLSKRHYSEDATLKDALKTLNKEELSEVGFEYNIVDVDEMKKGQLIEKVAELIFEELPERMYSMNTKHFEVLEKVMRDKTEDDEIFIESVSLLEEWGYVFSYVEENEIKAFVPKEVYECIQDLLKRDNYKAVAHVNLEMVDYLDTAMAYYGVATFDVLGEQFLKLYGIDMAYDVLYHAMIRNSSFSRHTEYDDENDFFANTYTEDPQELLEILVDLPPEDYKVLTRHFIDDYVKYEKITCESSDKLEKMIIDKARLEDDEVSLMVEEFEESIRHALPLEEHFKILDEVFDFLTEDSLSELKEAFEEMFMDIPQWIYKGYSINEMNGKKKRHLKLV